MGTCKNCSRFIQKLDFNPDVGFVAHPYGSCIFEREPVDVYHTCKEWVDKDLREKEGRYDWYVNVRHLRYFLAKLRVTPDTNPSVSEEGAALVNTVLNTVEMLIERLAF